MKRCDGGAKNGQVNPNDSGVLFRMGNLAGAD
jgi:hypothetical protein